MARQQFDINNEVNCYNVGTIKCAKHTNIIAVSFRFNLVFHGVAKAVKKEKNIYMICTQNVYASNKNVKFGQDRVIV